jgi:hypothetical protein
LGVETGVVQVEGCKSAVVGVKAASARERWRPFGEGKERSGWNTVQQLATDNLASEVTCNSIRAGHSQLPRLLLFFRLGASAYDLWISGLTHKSHKEMYKLPQELTDYIIDFLYGDFATLRRTSLVSKAWLESSRYHLFGTLSTKHPKLMEYGQADLATPCKYVRKLVLVWIRDPTKASFVLSNFKESKIHTLVITSRRVYQVDQPSIWRAFSTFPCARVTSLEFRYLFCQTRMFLAVISLLPNIDNLTIDVYRWNEDEPSEPDEDPTNKIISPSFRGRFHLTNLCGRQFWDYGSTGVLYSLARMPIRFHTVSFYVVKHNLNIASSFLDACAPTVQRITLDAATCKSSLHLRDARSLTSHFQSSHHRTMGSSPCA